MRFPARNDTIFAPATGAGRAAIAIVRLSGARTPHALATLAGGVPLPRRATLRTLRDADGRALDQAIVLYFPSPRSETGEDMGELHLHGGRAVMAAVLGALGALPGLRPAEPGEFAQRGLFNGKKSLLEVEALADLIDADTELQRVQALEGGGSLLRGKAEEWRRLLLEVHGELEAEIDFSDEEDVATGLDSSAERILRGLQDEIRVALQQGRRGEQIRDGFRVCLCGPPNAGKSTLLNRIAGREVAIVSDIAGTTRDRLEVRLDLNGVPVLMFDTAGIHESGDALERLGMERTRATALDSDLMLWLDSVDGPTMAAPAFGVEVWRVTTKSDLSSHTGGDLAVSGLTGEGVAALLDRIEAAARGQLNGEPALMTRERHRLALQAASDSIARALSAPDVEFRSEDIRSAERALGRLIGTIDVDDVLDVIFSRFCIGK